MILIYNNKRLTIIPDSLVIGDLIIFENKTYQIVSRCYIIDQQRLQAECDLIHDPNKPLLIDKLKKLFGEKFETSGANTDDISTNPRLIALKVTVAALIDKDYLDSNPDLLKNIHSAVVKRWNEKMISWIDILPIQAPSITIDDNNVNQLIDQLVLKYKLPRKCWIIEQ